MYGIEVFIIFSVTSFNFTVVSGSVRLDEFVLDREFLKGCFKEGFLVGAERVEAVCEFQPIIRLDAFNSIRETLNTMTDELGRGIGIMLFKCF